VVPVAAMLATSEVYRPFSVDPFLHTSTFAGSPLAMAAAEAAVRTLAEEEMVPRAAALGERILAGLRDVVAATCPDLVTDVRGVGLLTALQARDPAVAGVLTLALLDEHVLVNHSLNAHAVLRLTPPAVLRDDEVDRLLTAVAVATRAVARIHGRPRSAVPASPAPYPGSEGPR
jgi:putrescine aminotransferase